MITLIACSATGWPEDRIGVGYEHFQTGVQSCAPYSALQLCLSVNVQICTMCTKHLHPIDILSRLNIETQDSRPHSLSDFHPTSPRCSKSIKSMKDLVFVALACCPHTYKAPTQCIEQGASDVCLHLLCIAQLPIVQSLCIHQAPTIGLSM